MNVLIQTKKIGNKYKTVGQSQFLIFYKNARNNEFIHFNAITLDLFKIKPLHLYLTKFVML